MDLYWEHDKLRLMTLQETFLQFNPQRLSGQVCDSSLRAANIIEALMHDSIFNKDQVFKEQISKFWQFKN